MARRMHMACTIELSINKDLKLKERKGKERIGSNARSYIQFYGYIRVSRDTPVTPYTRPPVSTDSAIRDRSRDCRSLRQSTAVCHILPYSAMFCLPVFTAISAISATSMTSAEFYQVHRILPSSARTIT